MNYLFVSMAYINKKDGIMYTYSTGNFPVRSIDGHTAFFILYDQTTHVILVTPIKDAMGESMVAAFKENIEYLTERGFKRVFHVIDNVASKAIWVYLKEVKEGLQLVDPDDHRANATERAVETFKNHHQRIVHW